jgi:hypothetical protein
MNTRILTLLTLLAGHTAPAQTGAQLLEVTGRRYHFYIEMNETFAAVFKMTYWIDKAGEGCSIQMTDTPVKQENGVYAGKTTRIEQEQGQQYLVFFDYVHTLRTKKAVIKPVVNPAYANQQINNGYWFGSFFRMSDSINARFPMQHYSFRKGIPFWKQFTNKDIPYREFFAFTNTQIQLLRDSITAEHIQHTRLTQYLIDSMTTLDYAALKDGLDKLPKPGSYENQYFNKAVQAVCDKRPELFFKLAEDRPREKSNIFYIGSSDKATAQKLKAVNTDSPVKKEFIKELRWEKGFKIKTAVIYGTLLGLGIYALAQ